MRLFWKAHGQAFTHENILNAWQKAGIVPLNPRIVLDTVCERPRESYKYADDRRSASTSESDELQSLGHEIRLSRESHRDTRGADRDLWEQVEAMADERQKISVVQTMFEINSHLLEEALSHQAADKR